GLAVGPPCNLQPRLCTARRETVERTQEVGLVGFREQELDGKRYPRLRCQQAARSSAQPAFHGRRGVGWRQAVYSSRRRPWLDLGAYRTERRATSGPLRTAGITHPQSFLSPTSGQSDG